MLATVVAVLGEAEVVTTKVGYLDVRDIAVLGPVHPTPGSTLGREQTRKYTDCQVPGREQLQLLRI